MTRLTISPATLSLPQLVQKPLEEIEALLKKGEIDINQQYDGNQTILAYASQHGRREIVTHLIRQYKGAISEYSLNQALRAIIKKRNHIYYEKFLDIFYLLISEAFQRNSQNDEDRKFAEKLLLHSQEEHIFSNLFCEALTTHLDSFTEGESEEEMKERNKSIIDYTLSYYTKKMMINPDLHELVEEEHWDESKQYYLAFINQLVDSFPSYYQQLYDSGSSFSLEPTEKLLKKLIFAGKIKTTSEGAKKLFLFLCGSDSDDDQALLSLLLEKGMPPTTINESQQNGIMLAALRGAESRVKQIMRFVKDPKERLALIDAKDGQGMTATMLACQAQQLSFIKLLVSQYGAHINLVNNSNQTALMIAAARSNRDHPDLPGLFSEKEDREIVHYLLQQKANTGITDSNGETAYTLAQKVQAATGKNQTIVDLLAQQNRQNAPLNNTNIDTRDSSEISTSPDNTRNLEDRDAITEMPNTKREENNNELSQPLNSSILDDQHAINLLADTRTRNEEQTPQKGFFSNHWIPLLGLSLLGGVVVIAYWMHKKKYSCLFSKIFTTKPSRE